MPNIFWFLLVSLLLLNFLCIREPVIIYVEEGRGKKRTGGGGGIKAFSYWQERGGEGLNFFVKKFRGVSSLISRYNYFKRGPWAKRGKAVK